MNKFVFQELMKNSCKWSLLFFICFFLRTAVFAVSYIPPVRNYSVSKYKAGNQNWSIAQGEDGRMFFGNNKGLLVYDGARWQLHELPDKNAARSVYVDTDGRIYTGSFEEFGYFEVDNKGLFTYTSLSDLVTGYTFNNDEVWTIHRYQGEIYFQSFNSFFIYDGKRVTVGESGRAPLYFFSSGGELYAQFLLGGFCRKDSGGFKELFPRQAVNDDDVVGVLPYDDKLLLATVMNGLFLYDGEKPVPWNTEAGEWLKQTIANRVVMMEDSVYVVGTISNGLIGFNKNGEILWEINRGNSLMNNTVLGLFTDRSGSLWAALDNGLAQIQAQAPIQYADFSGVSIGMVHDMVIDEGVVYLATNQGVYAVSDKDGMPRMIHGSEEQAWSLSKHDNQLFVGHNKGTLLIENGKSTNLAGDYGGGMQFRKCMIHGQEILLQPSYTVLSVFTKKPDGRWGFSHHAGGFSNLIKSLEVDPAGNIWASHMHKGLYRIQLDNTLREAKETEYIDRLSPGAREGVVNVMKLRGRVVFDDGMNFYTYDDINREIIPYGQLNGLFPDLAGTYRIVPYDNDNYWFISDSEFALLAYEDENLKLKSRIPFSIFNNPPIEDRGNIYVDKSGATYFCLNNGFAKFIPANSKTDHKPASLFLSSLTGTDRSNNKSIHLPCQSEEEVVVNYTYNNLTFTFSYPVFEEQSYTIRYRLEGFESDWSKELPEFTRTYSNLPNGVYTMHALVHNMITNEDVVLSYPFTVKPPFYKSVFAFVIYIILFAALLILIIRSYVQWEVEREKKAAARLHRMQQEQLKNQEQLIMKLEKEKLEDELTYKSKELASATLSVISHNEFLEQLKDEIKAQKLSGSYSRAFFDKLMKMINDNITKEGDWTVFQTNFDRIHEKFFVKLKDRYPELTPGDLRMCALLRLNMPTKDMAGILSLSVRGVEAARYRLRKKLNLTEGESLTDFVITFE